MKRSQLTFILNGPRLLSAFKSVHNLIPATRQFLGSSKQTLLSADCKGRN